MRTLRLSSGQALSKTAKGEASSVIMVPAKVGQPHLLHEGTPDCETITALKAYEPSTTNRCRSLLLATRLLLRLDSMARYLCGREPEQRRR